MPPPIVLLDANVLIPATVRDLCLRAAENELCAIRWSDEILREVERNLPTFIHVEGNNADAIMRTKRQKAAKVIAAMRHAFPDALVTEYERHIPRMTNAPKDRHVTAAAYEASADIITANLKDFRVADLAPFNLRVVHPDAFLIQLFHSAPTTIANIIREMEEELTKPSKTVAELLHGMERAGLKRFVGAIRIHLDL